MSVSGASVRRFVTRAASLASLAALMLGTLPGTAMAQSDTKPLRAFFTRLECLDESNDNTWPNPDHDEPYALILVADLRGSNASARVFASQTFSDVDTGETRDDRLQFWDLNGNGAPISSDNDYIMLAALMESDNSARTKTAIVERLTTTFLPKLATYKAKGMSRSAIADALKRDFSYGINISRGFENDDGDDFVGFTIFEMVWGPNGLSAAQRGYAVELLPEFLGSDSRYKLTFRLE
jgi:hypothetical protein